MANKIYVNSDFYVRFVVNDDVSSDTVTVEYTNPSGSIVRGLSPTSVSENIVQYNVPKANNTVVGTWKFQCKVVSGGSTSYTDTIFVVVHERFT